jgi:hypothetical protein
LEAKLKNNFLLGAGLLLVGSVFLSGCAPLLIAGGAVGGYAIAKDMQDGKLIDDQKSQKK